MFAQSSFEKGYFVDNDGTRTDCNINKNTWSRDPKAFTYQAVDAKTISRSVKDVREFGVGEERYIRFEVQVDNSSTKAENISNSMAPEWQADTLFLKMLVDGHADLLHCKRNGEERFFYRINDDAAKQLVHKVYRKATKELGYNNRYQNQLKNDVNCRKYSDDRLTTLHYEVGVLIKFFKQQNECWGGEVKSADADKERNLRIKLTPGISYANAHGFADGKDYQSYNSGTGLRFGAEFEYLLPLQGRRWAVVLEPSWQSFSSEGTDRSDRTMKYNSFEVGLAARHYFYLTENNGIFVHGGGVLDIPAQYHTTFEGYPERLKSASVCAAVGLGWTYRRFSIEARYYTTRTTKSIANISTLTSSVFVPVANEYQKTSIIIGLRIF